MKIPERVSLLQGSEPPASQLGVGPRHDVLPLATGSAKKTWALCVILALVGTVAGTKILQLHFLPGAAVLFPTFLCLGLMLWRLELGAGVGLFLLPLISISVQSPLLGKPLGFQKLAVASLGLAWLVHRFRGGGLPLRPVLPIVGIWAAHILVKLAAAALLISSGGTVVLQVWFFAEGVAPLLVFLVAWDLLATPGRSARATEVLVASGALVIALGLLGWGSSWFLPDQLRFYYVEGGVTPRYSPPTSTIQHPTVLTAYLVLVLPLFMANWKRLGRWAWPWVVGGILLVALSSSQSGLLAFLIAAVIMTKRLPLRALLGVVFCILFFMLLGLLRSGLGPLEKDLLAGARVRGYVWKVSARLVRERFRKG